MTNGDQAKDQLNIEILKFRVRITVDRDTPGYHAYAPSLKGLHMGGDTEKEARENAKEAAALYLKSSLKHGDPLPIDELEKEVKAGPIVSKKHISSQVVHLTLG